jgi:hypothetical protein
MKLTLKNIRARLRTSLAAKSKSSSLTVVSFGHYNSMFAADHSHGLSKFVLGATSHSALFSLPPSNPRLTRGSSSSNQPASWRTQAAAERWRELA